MLKVGVIGVGSMGQNHARVYSEIAELVGVADPDKKTGIEVSQRFKVPHFSDHRELLKKDLDAVSIATPTALHYSVAQEVIERGIHLLVEKPFCGSLQRANEVVEMAEDRGLVLAAGMIERHNPVVEFARKALEEERYGKVITVSSRRVSSFPSRVRDVGVIMDLGIHDIDVMRYLLRSEIESVYALGGRKRHEEFEDHATLLLQFQNGVTGTAEMNWLTPMKVRKLALTCLKNFVELDYISQSATISSSTLMRYEPFNLYQLPLEFDIRQVSLEKQEPLKRELLDFLDAISKRRAPLVSGRDALKTLAAVEAAMRSQKEGRMVELA